ncbi:MAG TPA: hypothetical protein VHT04_07500 [Stellaceae bacterium]|jgi:hypothetical protein|nr:hypothetical protein [Stellaceae bacterium]
MDKIEPSDQSERKSYRLFSPPAGETADSERKRAWKGDSFSFHDFLDIINPLQHLPVVSTLYRWVTGDTIGAVPRMIGDAIYGGPIGFVTGLVNAEVKQESGKDVGEQMIALLGGDTSAPAADPKTIAAKEAAPDSAAPQASATTQGDAASPVAGAVAAASTAPGAAAPGVGAPAVAAISPTPSSAPAAPAAAMAAPANVATASGLHGVPAMGTSDPTDPRAIFLARTSMLHRQVAADNGSLPGRALSNHVVPLQGIAIPPGLVRTSAPARATPPNLPPVTDEGGTPQTSQMPQGLPANPPITISQQMMEALDKYARLQQQREAKSDPTRGVQVDLSH